MRHITKLSDIKKLTNGFINPTIYCHPANAAELEKQLKVEYELGDVTIHGRHYFGIEIIKDSSLPRFVRYWKFPENRFVEYEKSDEAWAIPLGHGHWEETEDLAFFVVDRMIFNNFDYGIDVFSQSYKTRIFGPI